MHIADAAMRGLGNFAAIGFDPVEVVWTVLVGDGFDGDIPRAIRRRLGVDLQGDDFSCEVLEIGVDVETGAGFAAVDRD